MRKRKSEYEIADGGIFSPHEEYEWKKIGPNKWVIFGDHYLFFEDGVSEKTGECIEDGVQYAKEYFFRHNYLVAHDVYLVITISEGAHPDDSVWSDYMICLEEPGGK